MLNIEKQIHAHEWYPLNIIRCLSIIANKFNSVIFEKKENIYRIDCLPALNHVKIKHFYQFIMGLK